jgi:hypothetical protein
MRQSCLMSQVSTEQCDIRSIVYTLCIKDFLRQYSASKMIDRLFRFVSLMFIFSNVRFTAQAFQHIEKLAAAIRLNVDTVSTQPFTINTGALFQPRCRIRSYFSHSNKGENEPEIIYVDEVSSDGNVIPDDVIEEMNAGQPSDLIIMKDVSSTST